MRIIRFGISICVVIISVAAFKDPINYVNLVGAGFWGTVLLTIFDN